MSNTTTHLLISAFQRIVTTSKMAVFRFIVFGLLSFFFFVNSTRAQVSITSMGTPFTTNFNSMGNVPNATLPTGFLCGGDWASGINQTTNNAGNAGAVAPVLSGTSAAGFYNFGTGANDTATDRAPGFIFSTAYRNPRSIMLAFTNNTGATVTQLNISWNIEKYRSGQALHYATLYHGSSTNTVNTSVTANAALNASTITVASSAGILPGMSVAITSGTGGLNATTVVTAVAGNVIGVSPNVTSAITSGATVSFKSTATTRIDSLPFVADANSATVYNPPLSYARSVTVNSLNIPNGSVYYLRWMISGSSSASPAIGIDDVSLTVGDGRCFPYRQAILDSVTTGPSNSLNVNYTRGNGNNILIVASTSATPPVLTNGNGYPTGSFAFNTQSLSTGYSVVYNGPGNNGPNVANVQNITGLSSSTPYYFYLYEYNDAGICYHPTVVSGNGYFTGSTDYFRSRASGNWNTPSTWESSKDNLSWVTALAKPDSLSRGIIIRSPDSVAIAAQETAENLTINAGATLSYNTSTVTAGSTFTIGNDPANEFDFNIFGRYIIFGNPATLAAGARMKVFNGGLIRADNNSGGSSDNLAFNQNVFFANGSVFEWNTTNSLNTSGVTYFNYLASQPIADVPIFRFTRTPSTPVGAAANTRINGITEVNAATGQLAFQSAGLKIFRNGITGTGTLAQNASCGQFVISGPAVLGGSGPINLSNNGLRIADTSVTTLLSDKPINGASPAVVMIDGSLYTSTFAINGTSPITVSATAKLYIGSPNGITASAASGNIQSSGTRTYNAAAAYHYYGTVNQVTGDGLPLIITGSLNIANTGAVNNNIVSLSNSGTTTSTLNLNNGLFACGSMGILNVSNGGFINGNGGNILNDPAAGTINFPGTGTVQGSSASVNFYNVSISNGVNFGAAITSNINNLLQINTGGFVNTNAPVYISGSTLRYSTGGLYNRGAEFSATTGKGYPHHVQVTSNSLLNMGSGGTSTARQMAGNLTIDAGASFLMDYLTNDMTAALTVLGDVVNNGTLNLSDAAGGDLVVGGNWTRGATALFNPKARSVTFNSGTANQTITVTGGGTEVFGYLIVNKSNNFNLTLQSNPATNITINGGNGGNALQLINGNLDLNGRTCNFNMFNGAVNNIGIDGSAGNVNRRISSTIAGGVFAIYNADASSRNTTVIRLSAQPSILIVNPGAVMTIGGLSQNSGINFSPNTCYINGTLQINTWGYVETNPPLYGVNSNLIYNAGGAYKRFTEWNATTGFGYPFNISIQNNTQLRINDDGPGQNGTSDRALAGTLTIQAGSVAILGDSTENNRLTIGRDFVLNGTIDMPSTVAAIGADLYIAGNWNRSSTGTFNHNERAVFFNGSTNSTITAFGGQYFPYLYLQKGTASNTLTLLDNISIGKIFTINAGKFDLGSKDATLMSNVVATAQFGPMGVNADVVYSGTGRFVVERYLPTGTGAGQHGKSWQFLAVPTNGGQTIKQAWQEGAVSANGNPNPGYGTQVTGNVGGSPAGATALGFDVYTPTGPSVKYYNNGTWLGIPNTNSTALYQKEGYMVFVRGDRSVTQFNQAATPTVLRTRGKLFVPVSNPAPTITIPAGSFQSIGNPFASAIEFTALDGPGVPDVDPVFYVWDPLLNGANGLGGYQMISANNGDFYPTPGGTSNYPTGVRCSRIQSGQAFMMRASGAGGDVIFNESCKVAGSQNAFRIPVSNRNRSYIRMFLHQQTSTDNPLLDGAVVAYDPVFSTAVDFQDASKLMNAGENMGISTFGRILSLDARSQLLRTDTIRLHLTNLRKPTYLLRFTPENMQDAGLRALLVDRYTNQQIAVDLSEETEIPFTVDAQPGSYRSDRFMLVFTRKSRTAPIGLLSSKTVSNSQDQIQAHPATTTPAFTIYPNPVRGGRLTMGGELPETGLYLLELIDPSGKTVFNQSITLQSGKWTKTLHIQVPAGSYMAILSHKNGVRLNSRVIVEK